MLIGLQAWSKLDASVQAAWAQAILSAMAIVVAGWLPFSVTRIERRRKIDAYIALIGAVAAEGESLAHLLEVAVGRHVTDRELEVFKKKALVCSSVSFHDLPDFRLVSLFHDVRDTCDELIRLFECAAGGSAVQAHDFHLVDTQAQTLDRCVIDGRRIRNDYSLLRLRNRVDDFASWTKWHFWKLADQIRRLLGRPPKRPWL